MEIPAAFFSFLAVYMFIRNKILVSGILIGLASLTKFTHLIFILAILVVISMRGRILRRSGTFLLGFLMIFSPFLIYSWIGYGNPFYVLIEGNKPEIFELLLTHAYNDQVTQNTSDLLIIGFHERDPLLKGLKGFKKIKYFSNVYFIYWGKGKNFVYTIDKSLVPYLEVGAL